MPLDKAISLNYEKIIASDKQSRYEKMTVNEGTLTKGQLRKLTALRKSVGNKIGDKAFADWMSSQPAKTAEAPVDRSAEAIANAVMKLIEGGKIKGLPRGGYVVKRGRGRVVVEPAAD